MRSPATQVPFLLPRSSIDTSRPVTFKPGVMTRDRVRIDLDRASAVAADHRLAGGHVNRLAALAVLALEIYLAWAYRKAYRSMLAAKTAPGAE